MTTGTAAAIPDRHAAGDRNRWIALVVLCAGMLMIILDADDRERRAAVDPEDLGFSQSSLAWVVNAYLIAFGGLLLLAGRLGDLIGRRGVFLAGLARLHARLAALRRSPQSQAMLIGARFVQGVGGALTSAVILGMIVTMFPEPREQAKAIGVYSFVASAGASIGLLAGGVLTEAHQLALDLLRQPADRHRRPAFLAVRLLEPRRRASASRDGADVAGRRCSSPAR